MLRRGHIRWSILMMVHLSACAEPADPGETGPEEVGNAASAVVQPSPYPVSGFGIAVDRSLIIRDLGVVNDPCRTRPNGGDLAAGAPVPPSCGSGGQPGIWSFAHLMTRMAGGLPVSDFLTSFFAQWTSNQTVNGFSVGARPRIKTLLLDPWWSKSGCGTFPNPCPGLDMARAPFRLLAIVNRMDLAGPGDPYSGGNPSLGELRFVFGALDSTGAPLDATFILEYKLPTTRPLIDWAYSFQTLSSPGLGSVGSPLYNQTLETFTALVTEQNANPGGPNLGSSIGQVRTNDGAFGPTPTPPLFKPAPWELREHKLDCSSAPDSDHCPLGLVPVAQTPANSFNKTPALDNFMVNSEPAILAESHAVPAFMLGGASTSRSGTDANLDMWDLSDLSLYDFTALGFPNPGGVKPYTRVLFASHTCNGCHYVETATNRFHIAPRALGMVSALSPFLSADATPDPTDRDTQFFHLGLDPAGYLPSDTDLNTNEPFRRVTEMVRILSGDPQPATRPFGAATH